MHLDAGETPKVGVRSKVAGRAVSRLTGGGAGGRSASRLTEGGGADTSRSTKAGRGLKGQGKQQDSLAITEEEEEDNDEGKTRDVTHLSLPCSM